jgi:hypothetical protein
MLYYLDTFQQVWLYQWTLTVNSYVHFAYLKHQLLNVGQNRKKHFWTVFWKKYNAYFKPTVLPQIILSNVFIKMNEHTWIVLLCIHFPTSCELKSSSMILCVSTDISLLYFQSGSGDFFNDISTIKAVHSSIRICSFVQWTSFTLKLLKMEKSMFSISVKS